MNVKKIAVFASGSGTNAQAIMDYFADNKLIKVELLLSNNPRAYALQRAQAYGVETIIIDRQQFYNSDETLKLLENRKIDLIVLAGFLWLVPENLISGFPIINIHPALLPRYGGKGMYGMKVHEAVVKNKDKQSGISVHIVNRNYDEGEIIFQAVCNVLPDDVPEDVATKVHELEHTYFPAVIEKYIKEHL